MNPPEKYAQIIRGRRYSVETATLLCSDTWWDGHNHERRGTNRFLYRTPKGNLFYLDMSQWQGSAPISITPIDDNSMAMDDAVEFFEACAAHGQADVEFEIAFPTRTVEDA